MDGRTDMTDCVAFLANAVDNTTSSLLELGIMQ